MRNGAFDLVRFASDAAFAIDTDRRITAWNDRAQHLLGYASSEAIGLRCGDVLQAVLPSGEPLCHHDCDFFECFTACRPHGVPSCRIRRRDGEWVLGSISSITIPERSHDRQADKVIAFVLIRDDAAAIPIPQHHTLKIFTLGGFAMTVAGRSIDIGRWKRKQAVTLLKYLITQLDRPVHRERLIDFLWPDAEEGLGRGRIKVVLYYLRHELHANTLRDDILKTVGDSYILRRDAVWVDADAFERLVADGRALQKQARWTDALDRYVQARYLYRGDFLEEDPYADWCAEERERLHELFLDMLAGMASCHAELHQYAEVVQICRKALVYDPCRESFHYALMEYLCKDGHPDLALAQYHHCREILARKFGVEPLPKTQRLYRQLLDEGAGAHGPHQGGA